MNAYEEDSEDSVFSFVDLQEKLGKPTDLKDSWLNIFDYAVRKTIMAK